jgi:hypothetical protein
VVNRSFLLAGIIKIFRANYVGNASFKTRGHESIFCPDLRGKKVFYFLTSSSNLIRKGEITMRYVFMLTVILIVPTRGLSAADLKPSIWACTIADTIIVPDDYPTIQGAIDAAMDGDTVLVKPDTYTENIDFLGKAITVMSSDGADTTIIDGGNPSNPDYGSVVIFNNGEGLDSVLEGFKLTNGLGTSFELDSGNRGPCGGGVFCNSSSPTLRNNTISGNNIVNAGGGIYCRRTQAMIEDNEIIKNDGALGGGIYCSKNAYPILTNNKIIENSALMGGGLYCDQFTSSPVLSNNTISGNSAGEGGGIYCCRSFLVVMNNAISNNSAWLGGGIRLDYSSPTLSCNAIWANVASGDGGGIYCSWFSSPTITNNTILGNTAVNGGGIFNYDRSSPIITNTILWDNAATTGKEIWIGGLSSSQPLTISYSDVKGGHASVYIEPSCTLNWWPGMIDADPLFVTGLEGDYYLSQMAAGQPSDSPCVDTGSQPVMNLNMNTCWTRTDEVPDSGLVDMGFHYGPYSPPTLTVEPYQIPEPAGGSAILSLSAGIENSNRNYFILGSISGTEPGTPLPGGQVSLPLNYDFFMLFVINNLNGPIFQNFAGMLDDDGLGTATFNVPASTGFLGCMNYAYALSKPYDFVSNPIVMEIVP